MNEIKGCYGKELILDMHSCDSDRFTRKDIRSYFKKVCGLIDMERCRLSWWDDYGVPVEERQTDPHLKGTSAVQFILTSNITIHTLDILKKVYLNLFSCKDFDVDTVIKFSEEWFRGEVVNKTVVRRV